MNDDQTKPDSQPQGEIVLTTLPDAALGDRHNETPTDHKARLQRQEYPRHGPDDEDSCRA